MSIHAETETGKIRLRVGATNSGFRYGAASQKRAQRFTGKKNGDGYLVSLTPDGNEVRDIFVDSLVDLIRLAQELEPLIQLISMDLHLELEEMKAQALAEIAGYEKWYDIR